MWFKMKKNSLIRVFFYDKGKLDWVGSTSIIIVILIITFGILPLPKLIKDYEFQPENEVCNNPIISSFDRGKIGSEQRMVSPEFEKPYTSVVIDVYYRSDLKDYETIYCKKGDWRPKTEEENKRKNRKVK